jgi:hypothetical protein
MRKLTIVIFFACILFKPFVFAEELPNSNVTFGGFVDTYVAHDFNNPNITSRPYTTQSLYEDQSRINLAMLDVNLNAENVRGRFALQAGDSVKSNYSAEQDQSWRYIQEATLGTKISDKLWLDAGIYLAHVGLETFNSRDNWNYTRSMVAEFSPYYETGAKLTYQALDSLTVQAHILNGWQNISSSAEPMYGLQFNYTPSANTQLIYANILGEQVDAGFRNFHDFILKQDITDHWSLAFQVDFGMQEQKDQNTESWHGFALLTQYKINSKLALGARIDKYNDPHQILVPTISGNSYKVTSLSANIDYEVLNNLLWRNEYRIFLAEDPIFPEDSDNKFSNNDHLIVTGLTYSF